MLLGFYYINYPTIFTRLGFQNYKNQKNNSIHNSIQRMIVMVRYLKKKGYPSIIFFQMTKNSKIVLS